MAEGNPADAYEYESSDVPILAQIVDMACDGAETIHAVSLRIGNIAASHHFPVSLAAVRELTNTFAYTISARPLGGQRPGATLGPVEGLSIFPRPLKSADINVRSLWEALTATVTHPVAKARCADIAFTLKLIRPDRAAEKAVNAYLEMVGGGLLLTEQCDGLLRALELVRSLGLHSLTPQVNAAMLDMTESALDRRDDSYIVACLLDALAAGRRGKEGSSMEEKVCTFIDRALSTYATTREISDFAIVIRKRMSGDIARVQYVNELEVKAHLGDASKESDALIARFHLNEAASKARQYSLVNLEGVAVSRLQSAPPVEWKTIGTEFKVPNAIFQNFLRRFREVDTWCGALRLWFATDSPSGDHRTNEATARNMLKNSMVSQIATTIMFDSNDLPIRTLDGDADALQQERLRAEKFSIRFNGILLADALDLIVGRFGIPSSDDLEKFLIESGSPSGLARVLAKSLILYWVGEVESSVHLAVPRVEAAVRALLLELNQPLYRAAVGDGKGGFPGLGVLLDPLVEAGFDQDWERFLRAFLLGDGGDNVRNLTAHGSMNDVSRETAALTLRALALMALITSSESMDRDAAAVRALLSSPLPTPSRTGWRRIVDAVRAARRELSR
ncbi:hypothetical protein [Streptomyces sp. NPDC047981]|uniref:DUF7380 domain-containing protein n=1 Tax=Streptomyces sp. NPDC047981 TaxID=3154610 RepID=UPI00342ACC9C